MEYLGIDVHSKASVWCLLGEDGEVHARGRVETTVPALGELVAELSRQDDLRVGQEVGGMAYLVHDAIAGAGAEILSFNAYQLRMIASSRKKTDRRDAYWIARALQTGMHPHPVYIPTGEVRRLRQLLSQRETLKLARMRWLLRAQSRARAAGAKGSRCSNVAAILTKLLSDPDGVDEHLAEELERCQRMHEVLSGELQHLDATIRQQPGQSTSLPSSHANRPTQPHVTWWSCDATPPMVRF